MSVKPSSKNNILRDGFLTVEGGIDSGFAPSLIAANQFSWAINTTMRGGFPMPRPGFIKHDISFPDDGVRTGIEDGLYQGAGGYISDSGLSYIAISVAGRIFTINLSQSYQAREITIAGNPNQAYLKHAWFQQAENWLIVQDGLDQAFLYNGATSRRADETIPEVPIGGPMAYGKGRLWVANGNAYVGGDLVGVPPYGRNNVIRFTENTYIAEGGAFAVPSGPITALGFAANIDTTLGQGDLLVHTPRSVLAFEAPEDRTLWKDLQYPIQRFALLNFGATSQESVSIQNGDQFYRAQDGLRSFVYARRSFQTWGQTSISRAVKRALQYDTLSLLNQCSSVNFDSRFLTTVGPQNVNGHGTVHSGLVSLDYDLVGDFQREIPPDWEGVWTGLRILRILTVQVNNIDRCYVIALSPANKIELWELTRSALFDKNGDDIPIQWIIESRDMTFNTPDDLKKLISADHFYDRLAGNLTATVKYRANLSECWHNWAAWDDCAQYRSCVDADPGDCQAVRYFRSVSRGRSSLPEPPVETDPQTNSMANRGTDFQLRWEFSGSFRFKRSRVFAQEVEEPIYGDQSKVTCPVPEPSDATCSDACTVQECCDPDDYGYSSYG